MARPKGQPKLGGRVAGTPNKVTTDARQAIAQFVDGNAHRLAGWLNQVAEGNEEQGIKPNPIKAAEMFMAVVEYHVPKLARTEVTGANNGPVSITFGWDMTGVKLNE